MDQQNACCSQVADECSNQNRRKVFKIAAAGLVAGLGLGGRVAYATEKDTGPRAVVGDFLVEEDAEGAPAPLKVSDLKPGKPLLAFPYDPVAKAARSDSRLNKVVLLRLPEAELDDASKTVAAGGVLAFSAICTHQGCDVKTWMSSEKVLACFCHASKFDARQGAKVVAGPAPRPLPVLPLKLDGEHLVVAAEFSSPPGAALQS